MTAAFSHDGLKRITHIGATGIGGDKMRSAWAFVTQATIADIEGDGFFDEMRPDFKPGDQLSVTTEADVDPQLALYVVRTAGDDPVTIEPIAGGGGGGRSRTLEDFGAKSGDDDAWIARNDAAIAAAIATGKPVALTPNALYKVGIGHMLASGTGFFCPGGWATFLMATSEGYFDCARNYPTLPPEFTAPDTDFINYTSLRRTLFQNVEDAEVVLDGVEIRLEPNAAPRTAGAVHFYKAVDLQCPRVRVTDFKENFGGVTRIRSCRGGIFHQWAKGISVNSTSLPVMQVSALELDDAIADEPVTQGMDVWSICEDFQLGADAREEYGEQTDCLDRHWPDTRVTPGRNRLLAWAQGPNGPGEVFDNKGCGEDVIVLWDDAYLNPIKMPYGGQGNRIRFRGFGSGYAAVLLQTVAGGVFAGRAPKDNIIEGECVDIGRHFAEIGGSAPVGVEIDGHLHTTNKSSGNVIRARVESALDGSTPIMVAAIGHVSGGADTYEVQCSNYLTKFAYIYLQDAASKRPAIVRKGQVPLLVRAHYGTNGPTSTAHGAVLPFDTEDADNGDHFDPSTKNVTLDEPGFVPISGQVYVTGLAFGRTVTLSTTIGAVTTVLATFTQMDDTTARSVHIPFSVRHYNAVPGVNAALHIGTSDNAAVNIAGNASGAPDTYVSIGPIEPFYPKE